jgi:prepilin-type N-terminal cleavage/methylation domain-containing protein
VVKNRVVMAGFGKCDGYTLVEILIAMTVASIGLIGLTYMQTTAIKGNTLSGKYTQAAFLAEHMLERVKNGHMVQEGTFGYYKISDTESDVMQDTGALMGVKQGGDIGGPFNVRWQVANHTDWSRQVTVMVSWKCALGYTRHLSLVSASRGKGA